MSADSEITANFGHIISALQESPVQLLGELRRFKHLFSRPYVREKLKRERGSLLCQLIDMMENTGEIFSSLIQNVIQPCPNVVSLFEHGT
mmetsp:Transcript_28192/g.87228  ORF Transcript_28192/g.87228 Transcript_28192/m.87228 type:complete len:90 (-) Transcript_28192:6278-6547(-)